MTAYYSLCIRSSESKARAMVSPIFLYEFIERELIPTCSHWLVVAVHPLQQATAKRS